MSEEKKHYCEACGRPFMSGASTPILIGSFIGFLAGLIFVVQWFGHAPGYFHVMAVVHYISGAVLGAFGGLIYTYFRNKPKK